MTEQKPFDPSLNSRWADLILDIMVPAMAAFLTIGLFVLALR